MHGLGWARSEHCSLCKFPSASIYIASPGSTSLKVLKPKAEKEAFSEATMYSFLEGPSLSPITRGRIP